MNQDTVGLAVNAVAAVRICAEYAGLLVRRASDFLSFTRNRELLHNWSSEYAWQNVDEILVDVPGARATNFWNTAELPVEQLPQKIASPFGDW